MVVKADVKYAVTLRPKNEDHISQMEVYPVYSYIESHTVGSIPLNVFENKFPSVICMWKKHKCVQDGAVLGLKFRRPLTIQESWVTSVYTVVEEMICSEISDNLFRGCSFESACLSL